MTPFILNDIFNRPSSLIYDSIGTRDLTLEVLCIYYKYNSRKKETRKAKMKKVKLIYKFLLYVQEFFHIVNTYEMG